MRHQIFLNHFINDPQKTKLFEGVALIFVSTLKTRCAHIYVSMDAGAALLYVLDMDQCCTHIKDPPYKMVS